MHADILDREGILEILRRFLVCSVINAGVQLICTITNRVSVLYTDQWTMRTMQFALRFPCG